MPQVNLTPAFVRTAVCPSEQRKVDFYDTAQRGFMLEVRASGGRTYYQRYTDARGRTRQFKVGPANVFTLDQARRKARSILVVTLSGSDPQHEREERREIPTLTKFAHEQYLPYIQKRKPSWTTDEYLLRLHILGAGRDQA